MSEVQFRGRRVLDPVPIQRRSLPQETRCRPSKFSDLEEAWKNVVEVKSALEAAEDRINEVQLSANNGPFYSSEPLQEIFSETQRYGRVARYNLRPDHHTKDVSPSLSPRRLKNQQISQPLLEPHSWTKDDIYPRVSSSASFEDSLEVSNARGPLRKVDPRSSFIVGGKTLLDSNSDVLTRLKERIHLQKQQVSKLSNEAINVANGETLKPVSKSPRALQTTGTADKQENAVDQLRLQPSTSQLHTTENMVLPTEVLQYTRPPLAKRKVASAPAAPVYKGFNEVDERPVRDLEYRKGSSKESKVHQRNSFQPYSTKSKFLSKDTSRSLKSSQNGIPSELSLKGSRKLQRITALRQPKEVISTASWRTGQQTVKRVLGPPAKKKSSKKTQSKIITSSGSSTADKSESLEWKEMHTERENEHRGKTQLHENNLKATDENISDDEADNLHDNLSEHTLSPTGSELQHDSVDAMKLKDSKVLSTEARNVLSDLDLGSEHSDHEQEKLKEVARPQSRQTYRGKKRKAPSKFMSEPVYPKDKLRHYDTEEVKKYMAKQVADRKKKIKEEKIMKQKAVEERKKKLEELYSKQKRTLQANLATKEKKRMGTTFSKGRSDPRSCIYPLHHPFHEDEFVEAVQDFEVSGSDKENQDVASYKGLPTHGQYSNGQINEVRYPADTVSEPSESVGSEMNMKDFEEAEDNQYSPFDNLNTAGAEVRTAIGGSSPLTLTESSNDRKSPNTIQPCLSEQPRMSSPASPNREDRINAIRHTAAALKERLEAEARRLGLNLEAKALGDVAQRDLQTVQMAVNRSGPEFRGNLPGVVNIHEQADLNKELNALEAAATKIQAAYRGHSVRQGLNWKLPSGQTLGATLKNAPRLARVESDSHSETIGSYHTPRNGTVSGVDSESIVDISGRSEQIASSSSDQRHRLGNVLLHSGFPSHNTVSEAAKPLTPSVIGNIRPSIIREPWPHKNGDSLSVINIFTRQHLKLMEDEIANNSRSETASLLEAADNNKHQNTASFVSSVSRSDQEGDMNRTLTEEPLGDDEEEYEDDFTEPSCEDSRGNKSTQRTPSPDRKMLSEDISYSQSFTSPCPTKKTGTSQSEFSLKHNLSNRASSCLESDELSARDPVMTSTVRAASVQTELPRYNPPGQYGRIHPPPEYFHTGQEGDRLSPGSLDHRMMAELHRLENMEESVRQLTDVERTRAVSLAQQETVSLAQILKARQQSHAREMESLRLRAKQEALESARQLEEARNAAALAAAEASETVAKVRTEAASAISQSADRLVQVQKEAARTTVDAAKQIEEAHLSAAKSHIEASRQQSADLHTVAVSAASAAASAAVKSALSEYQRPRSREFDSSRSYRESSRYSESYTESDISSSYSRTKSMHPGTRSTEHRSSMKSASGGDYTSDEFESYADSRMDKTLSVPTATSVSAKQPSKNSTRSDRVISSDLITASPGSLHSRQISIQETGKSVSEHFKSISEDIDHSIPESINTDVGADFAPDEESTADILSEESKRQGAKEGRPSFHDPQQYSTNFEDSVMSSHTATDEELDYRSVLPSESHRRRSLEAIKRRVSVASETGTFSYSSDEIADLTLVNTYPERERRDDSIAGPFSGEDSFIQFTSDMVRHMKEEEARSKHQAALLKLREKALKEKTKAEMAWLDLQKKSLRDKGADDVMPSLRKRQRGILMKLHAEQAEIKRLKTANRAASYERRLLLMQQEEIARLRLSTKKIRHRVAEEKGTERPREEAKVMLQKKQESERYSSPAHSDGIPEEISEVSLDESATDRPTQSRSDRSPRTDIVKTTSKSTNITEDITDSQSPIMTQADSSFPTYNASGSSPRNKRSFSDGESDEGSISSEKHSSRKTPPTYSDGTISKQLKKLKQLESDERFLTQREVQLKKRRKEAEKLLESRKKLVEWKKRLDEEDKQVRNLINQALNLKSATVPNQPQAQPRVASDEELERDKSLTPSKNLTSRESLADQINIGATRSTDRSVSSVGTKPSRTGSVHINSGSSVPEEVPSGVGWESEIGTELSGKINSQDSSMPEEIPGEYTNDTFESVESTLTPNHSTPVRHDASPVVSRRSSQDEGNKSEEDLSMTETSDHSDIEIRVRTLKAQLEQRKREAKRLYHERKRKRKALLRAQEDCLRKELQEVEMVINRTRKELEKEPIQNSIPEIKPSLTPKEKELAKQPKLGSIVLIPESSSTLGHDSSRDATFKEISLSELSSKSEPARNVLEQTDVVSSSQPINRSIAEQEYLIETPKGGVILASDIEERDRSRVEIVVDKSNEVKDLDISDRSRSVSPTESLTASESIEVEEHLTASVHPSSSEENIRTKSSLSENTAQSLSNGIRHTDLLTESEPHDVSLHATQSCKSLSKEEPEIKSPLSATGYSMSFESSAHDKASTADDISEHLSMEEESSIPEELSGKQNQHEKSEIEEAFSIGDSAAGEKSFNIIARQEQDGCKDTIEIPSKSLDTFPSYSAEFETPSVQNLSGKSEENIPSEQNVGTEGSVYTSGFEKEVSVKDSQSTQYTPDFQATTLDAPAADDKVSTNDENLPQPDELSSLEKDKGFPSVVAKEKEESQSEEYTVTEDIPDFPDEDEADLSPQEAGDKHEKDLAKDETKENIRTMGVDVLSKPEIEKPVEKIDSRAALTLRSERITDELTTILVKDAVDHMAGVYLSRLTVTECPVFTVVDDQQEVHSPDKSSELVSEPARVKIPSEEEKSKFEELPDVRSLETPSYLKGDISEEEDLADFSFDKDDSGSGLDFGNERSASEKKVDRIPGEHSLCSQRFQKMSRDSIVTKLSDDLVMEAVSQMISIMKKRKVKLSQSQIELDAKPSKGKEKEKMKEKKLPESFDGRVSPPRPGDVSPRSDTSVSPHPETSPRYMEKYMIHIPHKGGKDIRTRSPDRTRSPESHRDSSSPPGSPGMKREPKTLDGDELHRRLTSLQLNEQQRDAWESGEEEFRVNESSIMELPDDDDVGFTRPRGRSILFDVPHSATEVPLLVSKYLSLFYDNHRQGHSLTDTILPPELVWSADDKDLETCNKRVYQKLLFELTGDVFGDLLADKVHSHSLPWMKPKRRRKPRFHHGMRRLEKIDDYLPVVQQRVMHLVGLGDARPTLESVRRKTPLKTGKKDAVDAILIQELREEEPQWIDYDDDELAVKFQVADAILESLMSETVMVMNVIQDRRDARRDGHSPSS